MLTISLNNTIKYLSPYQIFTEWDKYTDELSSSEIKFFFKCSRNIITKNFINNEKIIIKENFTGNFDSFFNKKYKIQNIKKKNKNIYFFNNCENENEFFFNTLPRKILIINSEIKFIIINDIKFVLNNKTIYLKIKTLIK